MTETLNDLMEFDHVVQVHEDGTVTDDVRGVYAPELFVDITEDGDMLPDSERDMVEYARDQDWSLEQGWTGQYSYHGAFFSNAEYVGGALEEYILSTPGYWVAVVPTTWGPDGDDPAPDGWVLAFRPVTES